MSDSSAESATAMACTMPSHDELADVFLSIGAVQPPAELHGYISAFVALSVRFTEHDYLHEVVEFLDCDPIKDEYRGPLVAMYSATVSSLEAEAMQYQLVLPDDDTEFVQRVETLAFWCQGFLNGFAVAGKQRQMQGASDFSKEASELLNDLVAISQIGLDLEDEPAETDFFEICEYVRVAVLSLYAECHLAKDAKASASPTEKPTLH